MERHGNQCAATGFHGHRAEKSARRLRTDRYGSTVEKETCCSVGGGRHSCPGDSQAHGSPGPFRRRYGLSNSIPAIKSGSGTQAGRTGARARARELSDYHERETLPYDFPPHVAAFISKNELSPCPCVERGKHASSVGVG